ncbi:hypothetical protein CMV_024353 [Castanea mollissima]|uniref:Protein kinase domain-containing protein n=1 Tax=Castanea mollissima TaxID=60419 RepID=A0A8J4QFR1_9ROSI|nr:hypothetical protein CMV_024353 [Castanea mollissima]
MDPILGDTPPANALLSYINIALLCVQENAADRPTILDVIAMFIKEPALLPSPKKSMFSFARGYQQENPGQDLYIRLAASELRSIRESNMKESSVVVLMVSIICGMLTLGFVFWCITRKITSRRLGLPRKKEDVEVPLFDFTTVATATNKFSQENVIGAGGFGPVYKGRLCNGQNIAVKRLSKDSRQGCVPECITYHVFE